VIELEDWDDVVCSRGPSLGPRELRPAKSTEGQMREILGEMEVFLQYGGTMNYSGSTGGDGESGGRPPGSEFAAHDHWRERYNRAFNKRKVVDDAREALEAMRKQKRVEVVPETEAELQARILKEGVGWGVTEIANHCRCTEKMVRRARENGKVAVEDGKGVVERNLDRLERQEEARKMRERGLTMRQIATLLGVNVATVQRDLANVA